MNYRVLAIPNFRREVKKLAIKFPSVKVDLETLVEALQVNPKQGVSLGHNCYKIRLNISSKGKGKAGGARIITCLQVIEHAVYLLSIYDKSDKETITTKELKHLLNEIPE